MGEDDMTIERWFPIDGKWRHLVEVVKDSAHRYFVDGVESVSAQSGRDTSEEP